MMRWFRRPKPPPFVQKYAAGPWPAPNTPWREVTYAVVDVETSGLNARRDALLAVGLVPIIGGRVQMAQTWYSLVRPPAGLEVGGESIRIHGLTRAELAGAPPLESVLPTLLTHLAGRALIVHVAGVDVAFLNRALTDLYGTKLHGPILDTARIALTMHQRSQLLGYSPNAAPPPALQLRALAASFGLPVHPQHNALSDALTTAQIFLAQATYLQQHGRGTLRGLLRAGGI